MIFVHARLLAILIALAVFILAGCDTRTIGDLRAELGGSRFSRTISAGPYDIEIKYLPLVIQRINEAGLNDSIPLNSKGVEDIRRIGSSSTLTFIMSIQPRDERMGLDLERDIIYGKANGFEDSYQALQTFQFGLGRRIWLETEAHRIPLAQFHMENTFGIRPGRDFVLQFDRPAIGKEFRMVIEDLLPGLPRTKVNWALPENESGTMAWNVGSRQERK